MGYYLRVLSTAASPVPIETLRAALRAADLDATLNEECGADDAWTIAVLADASGAEWAEIERNPVSTGGLGDEELAELIEEVQAGQPETSARWLGVFLGTVRTIYAIRVLSAADDGAGWDAIRAVQGALWNAADGILQADGEGFSNLDGYHVLWQFSDKASGDWKMAVLDEHGCWTKFVMDLGDAAHRAAFLAGCVPEDAEVIP